MERFEGRVAVVTGAGSGIGRATAERLAELGCSVALTDIDPERLAEVADAIGKRGAKATVHVADAADATRMSELPAEVVDAHGAVHIVVNNAGVSVSAAFEEQSLEDFEWLIGINFWGVIYGCKFFLPELRKVDEAHIVNVSSMFGFLGLPSQSSYCASKFAVRGFTESLWTELHDTHIGVSSVHPGGIKTNIVRDSRVPSEDVRGEIQQGFDRFGHPPEQVADAIVRAIRKRKLRVIIGWEAYVTEALKRLFPVGIHRFVAWRNRTIQAKREI